MGRYESYLTYKRDTPTAWMQTDRDEFARNNGDWQECGGDPSWHLGSLALLEGDGKLSMDEAKQEIEAYLQENPHKREDGVAILCQSTKGKTARMRKLEADIAALEQRTADIRDEALPSARKGALTTCKGCGSKLSNRHLGKRDACPVCGETLLSSTAQERIASARERAKAKRKALEQARRSAPSETIWLMLVSVHC